MATGYRPYTSLVPRGPIPTGYAPGGYSYFAQKKTRPKVFGPTPTTGYAPGGVAWKPISKDQQVGAGGAPWNPAAPGSTQGDQTGGGGGGGGGGAGGGGGGGGGGDFPNDPIFQQINAIANAKVAQAQAQATAARKQLAIEMGDPGLATSLGLGKLVSETAQANPFSTLKNLLRNHLGNADRIDTSLNRANLFSSSTRGRQQQLEGTGYLGNVAGAQASAQKVLASILQNLLAAQNAAAEQKAAAAAEAYRRAKEDEPPAEPPPATKGSGPNGEWTQADAFSALLGQATKRANKPPARGPSGGV